MAALSHVLGKALCYAVLGAAVAGLQLATHGGAQLLGGEPGRQVEHLRRLQRAAAWVGGALFVTFALSNLGLLPGHVRAHAGASSPRGARWLGFLADQARSLPRRGRGFATGLVNGLLALRL